MTASTAYDLVSALCERADSIRKTYIGDMAHLSDEQLASSPMGCARSCLNFTAEVGMFSSMAARLLRGETVERLSPEERAAGLAAVDTREKAVALMNEGTDAMIAAIRECGPDGLGATVTLPWGEQMPKHGLAEMAIAHAWYHDGQINYVQSCFGDGKFHWMDE